MPGNSNTSRIAASSLHLLAVVGFFCRVSAAPALMLRRRLIKNHFLSRNTAGKPRIQSMTFT